MTPLGPLPLAPLCLTNATEGWRSRGYLPHLDQPGLVQFVTFRLGDALPASRRAEWAASSDAGPRGTHSRRVECFLDAGHGSCALRHPAIGAIVEGSLPHFDGERYHLFAWVVMPNHVHVVEIVPGQPLAGVLHSWKSFSSSMVGKLQSRSVAPPLPGLPRPFWQRESHDRFIRDQRHLEAAVSYTEGNPVEAGLVGRAEDWPFGSARLRRVV